MQSILFNTLIATVGRLVNVVLGVVALALMARYLGPAWYGSWVLVFSFGTMVALAADFGLYLTLTREIAEKPGEAPIITANIITLRLVLVVIAFLLGGLLVWLVPSFDGLGWVYMMTFVGFLVQSVSQLLMGWYQYYQSIWRATVGDIAGRLVQVGSIYLVSLYEVSIEKIAFTFMASGVVALTAHYLLLPQIKWRPSFDWLAWKKILKNTWPLGVMLVLNAIYFRIDVLLLSLFRSAAELGWYGAAYRIIDSALFFPAMLGGLLLPRISEAWIKRNTVAVRQFIREGFFILFPLACLTLVVLSVFSQEIIIILVGEEYIKAAAWLATLGLALAIMFIGNLFGFALVALRRQMFLLKLYAWLAFFNVLANLWLIPLYGATAAAWTTVATEALSMSLAVWCVRKTVSFVLPAMFMFEVGLVTGVVCLVALVLPQGWPGIWRIMSAVFLFAVMIFAFKIVRLDDFKRLRKVDSR